MEEARLSAERREDRHRDAEVLPAGCAKITQRKESTTRWEKAAYSFILLLGALSVLSGLAIWKPVQLWWLTVLFGGFQPARSIGRGPVDHITRMFLPGS